jgi:hypothetical protein
LDQTAKEDTAEPRFADGLLGGGGGGAVGGVAYGGGGYGGCGGYGCGGGGYGGGGGGGYGGCDGYGCQGGPVYVYQQTTAAGGVCTGIVGYLLTFSSDRLLGHVHDFNHNRIT